jgi:type IV pilus assembly protein PilB
LELKINFKIKMQDSKIKEILLAQDYITEKDVAEAEKYALSHHASFLDYFYQKQLISEELVHQAVAEYYKLPYFDLEASPPEKASVLLLPKETAEQYQALVVAATEKQIGIALKGPLSTEDGKALKAIFPQARVILYYANPDLIDQFWRFYRPTLDTRFSQILKSTKRVAPDFVDQIITDALAIGASDIHCEPQEKEVLIRFRVDGVLHEAGRVPLDQYGSIVNRVKVLASLRIDEHQTSQDGSIHFAAEGKSSDLRISIVPTVTGEKVVLRVLSEYVRDFTLSDLGMSEQDQELINEAVSAPYGMI